jgi:hypothetical protein
MNPRCYAPYLDPNHPNFSTLLFIALSAWQSLFGDVNKVEPAMNVKEALKKWLKENNEVLNEEELEYIANIITPDCMKKGDNK